MALAARVAVAVQVAVGRKVLEQAPEPQIKVMVVEPDKQVVITVLEVVEVVLVA
jgi:hypothetical protein